MILQETVLVCVDPLKLKPQIVLSKISEGMMKDLFRAKLKKVTLNFGKILYLKFQYPVIPKGINMIHTQVLLFKVGHMNL